MPVESVEVDRWLDGERLVRLIDSDAIDMALAQAEELDKREHDDRRVVIAGRPEDCRYRIQPGVTVDELLLGIEYPLKVHGGLEPTFRKFRVRIGRSEDRYFGSAIVLVSSRQFAALRAVAGSDTRPRAAIR